MHHLRPAPPKQHLEGWNRHFGDMIIFLCVMTFGQLLPYPVILLAMFAGLIWFFYDSWAILCLRNCLFYLLRLFYPH